MVCPLFPLRYELFGRETELSARAESEGIPILLSPKPAEPSRWPKSDNLLLIHSYLKENYKNIVYNFKRTGSALCVTYTYLRTVQA